MSKKPPKTPVDRLGLGLGQRLVKSWRLRTLKFSDRLRDLEVGAYVDPKTGLFYARVPEADDGTLYAAPTLQELSTQLLEALRQWHDQQAEQRLAGRTWERCIRIRYDGGSEHVGKPVTAESQSTSWRRSLHAPGGAPCTKVGVLVFVRFERSLTACGRWWDEREWAEDYEERVRRWRVAQEDRRNDDFDTPRPARIHQRSWTDRRPNYGDVPDRVVPWTQQTWDDLCSFASRFGQLHRALLGLLIECEPDLFLARLGTQGLLTGGDDA